jgi:hypothetical protein
LHAVLILYIEFGGGSAEIFFFEGVDRIAAWSVCRAALAEGQVQRGNFTRVVPKSRDGYRLNRIRSRFAFICRKCSLSWMSRRIRKCCDA